MRTPSLFARFISWQHARGSWRSAAYVLGGALLCEIAARVSFIGPEGKALSEWFDRGEAGAVLRLYDKVAGFGVSRGTVAALGLMPYLSARLFTWVARSVSPMLDRRWSDDEERAERTRWTRGLTLGLALVQSYGFARFTQTIPGVVAQPGAQYIAETMLVQTAVAMFLMWVVEQVTAPIDTEARSSGSEPPVADRGLLGHDAGSAVFTSRQPRNMMSPDHVRHDTPVSRGAS